MRGAMVALASLLVACGPPCGGGECQVLPLEPGEYVALMPVDRGEDGTLVVDEQSAVLTYTDADGNVWEVSWDVGPTSITEP
ncbi:MAG: hypothetical protein KC621_33745 [Myxococcales bacterium]|nr:hypothetical protein [Myxococcales bacterium]